LLSFGLYRIFLTCSFFTSRLKLYGLVRSFKNCSVIQTIFPTAFLSLFMHPFLVFSISYVRIECIFLIFPFLSGKYMFSQYSCVLLFKHDVLYSSILYTLKSSAILFFNPKFGVDITPLICFPIDQSPYISHQLVGDCIFSKRFFYISY